MVATQETLTVIENPETLPLQGSRISNPISTLSINFNYLNTTRYLTLSKLSDVSSLPFRSSVCLPRRKQEGIIEYAIIIAKAKLDTNVLNFMLNC